MFKLWRPRSEFEAQWQLSAPLPHRAWIELAHGDDNEEDDKDNHQEQTEKKKGVQEKYCTV